MDDDTQTLTQDMVNVGADNAIVISESQSNETPDGSMSLNMEEGVSNNCPREGDASNKTPHSDQSLGQDVKINLTNTQADLYSQSTTVNIAAGATHDNNQTESELGSADIRPNLVTYSSATFATPVPMSKTEVNNTNMTMASEVVCASDCDYKTPLETGNSSNYVHNATDSCDTTATAIVGDQHDTTNNLMQAPQASIDSYADGAMQTAPANIGAQHVDDRVITSKTTHILEGSVEAQLSVGCVQSVNAESALTLSVPEETNVQLIVPAQMDQRESLSAQACGMETQAAFIGPQQVHEHEQQSGGRQLFQEMETESYVPLTEGKLPSQVTYDFSNRAVPSFVTWAQTDFVTSAPENFLKGCKWSPNGTQVLTNSNDNVLRVFSMSSYVTDSESSADIEQVSDLSLKESGTVYDYAWHPASDRIATTCSGIPMHLWDTMTGKIVASFKAYDQYDEITAAYSLSFSSGGEKLFGGYNKAIRVFDTEYPGKKCRLIKTCAPKKKSYSQPSQTGIISCFAQSPNSPDVLAAGSYTRHVGLYDFRSEGPTCVFEGQKGGITHMMFSPDGNQLFTGARKDKEILCWDMRNLGVVCYAALRDVRTNQRIYFDISMSGRYMTSGSDDGTVTFWDLHRLTETHNGADYLRPIGQFKAHGDSVNGASFHPDGLLLASASGQRHFCSFDTNSSDSDSSSESSSSQCDNEEMWGRGRGGNQWDFSLRIWRMPLAVR